MDDLKNFLGEMVDKLVTNKLRMASTLAQAFAEIDTEIACERDPDHAKELYPETDGKPRTEFNYVIQMGEHSFFHHEGTMASFSLGPIMGVPRYDRNNALSLVEQFTEAWKTGDLLAKDEGMPDYVRISNIRAVPYLEALLSERAWLLAKSVESGVDLRTSVGDSPKDVADFKTRMAHHEIHARKVLDENPGIKEILSNLGLDLGDSIQSSTTLH